MSPQRQQGSTRDGTGRTEVRLTPEQLDWIRANDIELSALVRGILDQYMTDSEQPTPVATDEDGKRIIRGDLRPVGYHGLRAMGRQVRVARLALGDADGLAAALAEVPDGWEARTTTTGRVRVVARPIKVWRVVDG